MTLKPWILFLSISAVGAALISRVEQSHEIFQAPTLRHSGVPTSRLHVSASRRFRFGYAAIKYCDYNSIVTVLHPKIIFIVFEITTSASGMCISSLNGKTYLNAFLLEEGNHDIQSKWIPNGQMEYAVKTSKPNGETSVKMYRDDGRTQCKQMPGFQTPDPQAIASSVMQSICVAYPDWMKPKSCGNRGRNNKN